MGIYKYLILLFDLKNGPYFFQQYINEFFFEYFNDFCQIYFDDIMIYNRIRPRMNFNPDTINYKSIRERLLTIKTKDIAQKLFFGIEQ